jgi:hypothetical protein
MLVTGSHAAAGAEHAPLPWPKPAGEVRRDASTPPLPLEKPDLDQDLEEEQPGAPAMEEEEARQDAVAPPAEQDATAPPLPLEKPVLDHDLEEEQPGAPAIEEDEAPAPRAWSREEIDAAREQCREVLSGLAITYREVDAIGAAQDCGIAAPIEVSQLGIYHPVEVSPPAILNCTMAAALHEWVETVLQKSAMAAFAVPVTRIQNSSGYACRRRNNNPDGKLSEHALGNAFDVSAFYFADREPVSVKDDWPGVIGALLPDAPARFLVQVNEGACTVFSTILGPRANASHQDHFHFDLGRGGRYLICE